MILKLRIVFIMLACFRGVYGFAKIPSLTWRKMAMSSAATGSEAVPPTPKSFGKSFQLPARNDDIFHLQTKHIHPNDDKLTFDEEPHIYYYDNKPIKLSVTGLVDTYFDKFNPEEAVAKMMDGRNWPREGYIHENGTSFTKEDILKQWENIGLQARNKGNDQSVINDVE